MGIVETTTVGSTTIEAATKAYDEFKRRFGSGSQQPTQSLSFLYHSGNKCSHLHSSRPFIPDEALVNPLIGLLVIADLADLLIECRDTSNIEQLLIEWDSELTQKLNALAVDKKCSELKPGTLQRSEFCKGDSVNWVKFVAFADTVHLSIRGTSGLADDRNELSLRLKPEGVAAEVVDFFLERPNLLSLVEKAGFCSKFKEEIFFDSLRKFLWSSEVPSASRSALSFVVSERMESCKERNLLDEESFTKISNFLKKQEPYTFPVAQRAVEHLRHRLRSWASRKAITSLSVSDDQLMNTFITPLVTIAGLIFGSGRLEVTSNAMNAFTPLMVRIWGGPEQCYGVPSLLSPSDEDMKTGLLSWNSYGSLLLDAFMTVSVNGDFNRGFILFALLDRWLSNCRLTVSKDDPPNWKPLLEWQEEADRVRDDIIWFFMQTEDKQESQAEETLKMELEADLSAQKINLMTTWSVGVRGHSFLKEAAQWFNRVLQTLKSGLCELSEGIGELINEVMNSQDHPELRSMKIGGLLWELEMGLGDCKGTENEKIARVSQKLWQTMQSSFMTDADLRKLDGGFYKFIDKVDCRDDSAEDCIHIGLLRRLKHIGLDVSVARNVLSESTNELEPAAVSIQQSSGPRSNDGDDSVPKEPVSLDIIEQTKQHVIVEYEKLKTISLKSPDSPFHALYGFSKYACSSLYSKSLEHMPVINDPMMGLVFLADLADLLLKCRDSKNNENKLIEWDRALRRLLNSITSNDQCSELPEYLRAVACVSNGNVDWVKLVDIAQLVHHDPSHEPSQQLSIRLKPKGSPGEVVDYFLNEPQLLSLVEKAGFCSMFFKDGFVKELIDSESQKLPESHALSSAIINTLKFFTNERLQSCIKRKLLTGEMGAELLADNSQADGGVKEAVDYLRALMQSWADSKITTPVLPETGPVFSKKVAQLMSLAGFTSERGSWVFSRDNWNIFTPLIGRVWGGSDACLGIPSVRSPADLQQGEPKWHSYDSLLTEAFQSIIFTADVESGLLFLAILDRWLSSCRRIVRESDKLNWPFSTEWQEEADKVRDFAACNDITGTISLDKFASFERKAGFVAEQVDIARKKAENYEIKVSVTQAAKLTDDFLKAFNQDPCSPLSSEVLRDCRNLFQQSETQDTSPYKIGSLIWQFDLRIAECKTGAEGSDPVEDSLERLLSAGDLSHLASAISSQVTHGSLLWYVLKKSRTHVSILDG